MKITASKYFPFYIFTISVIIILVAPFLLQDGMFIDGQQYACVAQNLANGKGSFWLPIASDTWTMKGSNYFLEHPPLFYYIESCVFRTFGNSMYSERLFCLIMVFTNAFLIHKIWELLTKKDPNAQQLSWVPVLLWISIPICTWAFRNNMIEILMSVFTLLSVLFVLKSLLTQQGRIIYLVISGLFILAAFLTKGLPGLFPLLCIPLYYLTTKCITLKQMVLYTTITILAPLLLYLFIIYSSKDAFESMNFYIHERLLNRINSSPTTNFRFSILLDLCTELLTPILITLFVLFLMRKKIKPFNLSVKDKQYALFFLLIGLFGSLPLMATMVQKSFYFVASLPYFALAFAFICYPYIQQGFDSYLNKKQQISKIKQIFFFFLVFSIIISLLQIGKCSRDTDKLADIKYIGDFLKNEKNEKIVCANTDAYYDWSFQIYLYRKYAISLDPNNTKRSYLITKSNIPNDQLKYYQKIELPLTLYKLYKLK